jgi:hypothetical protein
VDVRVADVDRDGVAAVLLEQRHEPALDLREGLLPRHIDVLSAATNDRPAQAVWIVVQRAERGALGADEAA